MLAVFAIIQVKPAYRDRFIEASMGDAVGSTKNEPGCHRFDVLRDDNDPNQIYFYEVYQDETALRAHLTMPHYRRWQDTVAGWTTQPIEIVRMRMVHPSLEAGV